jgi:hypothetical protein
MQCQSHFGSPTGSISVRRAPGVIGWLMLNRAPGLKQLSEIMNDMTTQKNVVEAGGAHFNTLGLLFRSRLICSPCDGQVLQSSKNRQLSVQRRHGLSTLQPSKSNSRLFALLLERSDIYRHPV